VKSAVVSILVIAFTFGFVIFNSFYISSYFARLEGEVDSIEVNEDYARLEGEFSRLDEDFDKMERYLSLSIHDKLLFEVEGCFGDVISYAKAENHEGVLQSKSRLKTSISQLRRLSGFNLKSIF